jgi:hypothetical protein
MPNKTIIIAYALIGAAVAYSTLCVKRMERENAQFVKKMRDNRERFATELEFPDQ